MDGQEYLNQISGVTGGVRNGGRPAWLSSPIFKVLVIGVVGVILMMIVGAILGNGGDSFKDRCFGLKLKLDRTISAITDYQTEVKSSELRSYSASLSGVLSNTNREFENYLVEKYKYKEKSVAKNITAKADEDFEELSTELFTAKINGNLDRIFAIKMSYEISLIMAEESSIYAATNNEDLKKMMQTSHESLSILYENFNGFSEAKK